MKAVFFAAGLGDFIRVCYKTNSYALLSETEEMIAVVLALHNPYAAECFAHHPNRRFLRVIDLPGHFEFLRGSGMKGKELHHALMRAAGVEPDDVIAEPIPSKPIFHAVDDVRSNGHIFIQPFASGANRNVPMPMLMKILSVCARTGREVHIVTRSYTKRNEKGQITHSAEELAPEIARHHSVVWHRNLSVPATINLVKSASLFVGSHSAMLQAAWLEGKPAHVLYPKGQVEWTPERVGTGYTFGANFENTVHQNFTEFRIERLENQLELITGPLRAEGSRAGEPRRVNFLRGRLSM